jgi:hypothetical protein
MLELILLGAAMASTAATGFFLNRRRFATLPVRAGGRKPQR